MIETPFYVMLHNSRAVQFQQLENVCCQGSLPLLACDRVNSEG